MPVQAVIVTLFLNKAVNAIQKQQNSKKVNVIISAFFSELGLSIVSILTKLNENMSELGLQVDSKDLNRKSIADTKKKIQDFDFKLSLSTDKLEDLGCVLIEKKNIYDRHAGKFKPDGT